TTADRVGWFFQDNAGVLVALVGLIGLLLFCFRRWSAIGRDPPTGVIIPRYEPRTGQSPGGARYLGKMGYDDRCFTADALDLAVGGHLRIHREGEGRKDAWLLERRAPVAASRALGRWVADPSRQGIGIPGGSPVPPAPTQRVLLDRLFRGGKALLELETSNATTLREARSAHRQALDDELHGRYFHRNGTSAAWAFAITATTAALAMLVSGGNGVLFI